MKCDIKGCNDWFPSNMNGLLEMTWHKAIKHKPEEINGVGYVYEKYQRSILK